MIASFTGHVAFYHSDLRGTAMHTAVAWNTLAMWAVGATFAMCLAGKASKFVGETPRAFPGTIGCESIARGGSFTFVHQVAFIDHTLHLRGQQVFISGQKGLEVTDGEGLTEALSLVPVHDLQDLIAPVELIEWLHLAHLVVRMLHRFSSSSCVYLSTKHTLK